MKNYLRKGFTLIELLIVIVIIGVLATAVLSAINPIEQINKAEDAGTRSDSAELLNALERYYTSFNDYPSGFTALVTGGTGYAPSSTDTWLSDLITRGELKAEFTARKNLTAFRMFTYLDGTNTLVRVCFTPQSNSYRAAAGWTSGGSALTGCTTAGCYECVPE